MRAVVLNGPGDVTVERVEDPQLPGPSGVVVQVERTAICGSDLHLYHGEMGEPGTRLGHEFIGTVTDAGDDVRRLSVGQRVLVSGVIGCGRCEECLAGWPMRCLEWASAVFGTGPELPGGQAEAVAVPAADAFAVPIPEDVTDEAAVLLTDILPTGFLGARRADIAPGDTVAVIGLGPVGQCALMAAQLHGPARVLAVDPVASRREAAAELGAEPVDPGDGGTQELLAAATGGYGPDCVIEAVGADATITDAVMSVRRGGTVSVVGVNVNLAFPFPMAVALMKGITFRICVADIPSTWPALVPLLRSGRLEPDRVFTHRLGLSEAPEAYRRFDAREEGLVKVLLDPTG